MLGSAWRRVDLSAIHARLRAMACLGGVNNSDTSPNHHSTYLERLRCGVSVRNAIGGHLLDVRVSRAAHEASQLLVKGAVVGEVGDARDLQNVERWRQGEAELATHDALRRRFRLREASTVVDKLDALYRAAIRLGAGGRLIINQTGCYGADNVNFAAYSALYQQVHQLLIEDYDAEEVEETILQDWAEEMARCHPGRSDIGGEDIGLTREAFGDSLFELCDLWCDSIDASDYAGFLHRLLNHIEGAEEVAYDAKLAAGLPVRETEPERCLVKPRPRGSRKARAAARRERRNAALLIQAQCRGQRARRESEERRKKIIAIQRTQRRRHRPRPSTPPAVLPAVSPATTPAEALWLPDYSPVWWPPTPWKTARRTQHVAPRSSSRHRMIAPPSIWPDAFGNRTFNLAGSAPKSARRLCHKPLASDWLLGLDSPVDDETDAGENDASAQGPSTSARALVLPGLPPLAPMVAAAIRPLLVGDYSPSNDVSRSSPPLASVASPTLPLLSAYQTTLQSPPPSRELRQDVLLAEVGVHDRQLLVLSSHGALKLMPSGMLDTKLKAPSPPLSPRSPRTPRPGGWRPLSTAPQQQQVG